MRLLYWIVVFGALLLAGASAHLFFGSHCCKLFVVVSIVLNDGSTQTIVSEEGPSFLAFRLHYCIKYILRQ